MKAIYNLDIPKRLWLKRFNRDQLRNIAQEHGIKRGRNAADTARNLACGIGSDGTILKFEMDLFNPLRHNANMEAAVPFPHDDGETTIEVFYRRGDSVWVCGAHGSINGDMIEEIEDDFDDNPDEGFDRGDGLYLYVTRWEPPQVDGEGRIELPGYWDLELVGFRPMERVMANAGAVPRRNDVGTSPLLEV